MLRPSCGCRLELVGSRWRRVKWCGRQDCIGRENVARWRKNQRPLVAASVRLTGRRPRA